MFTEHAKNPNKKNKDKVTCAFGGACTTERAQKYVVVVVVVAAVVVIAYMLSARGHKV